MKFSFIPAFYYPDDADEPRRKLILATKENYISLKNFINSKTWLKEVLPYCFDDLRPFVLPFYTPEMYYVDNISTTLDIVKNVFIIRISGIIKKYSVEDIKKKYFNNDALNKSGTDQIKEKFTIKHLKELIKEGFHKLTNEGEVPIPGIGRLAFYIQDKIGLKIVRLH